MILQLLFLLLAAGAQGPVGDEPIRPGGDIAAPARVKALPPVYPENARQAWVQGLVILELLVNPEGKVDNVRVLRSIPLLDEAAVAAVKRWEYEPPRVEGKPVSMLLTETLNFTLPGGEEWTVFPEGKAELRLESYDLDIGQGESRTYSGTLKNLSGENLENVVVALTYKERFVETPDGETLRFEPPEKLKDATPVYPTDAQRRRIQGTVIAEVFVETDGKVEQVRVLRSIPELDQAVTDAVQRWEYEPIEIGGTPVPFAITVEAEFAGRDVRVEESIAPEDVGIEKHGATVELGELDSGATKPFTMSASAQEGGKLDEVRVHFLAVEKGRMREVPTERQLKTITP